MTTFIETGPASGPLLLLAHGAGAGMESPFLQTMALLLAERGLATLRFEFDYMAARRLPDAKRRPPPKAETLGPSYVAVLAEVFNREPRRCLLIGGKSMGGRVASLVAQEAYAQGQIAGLVCLGYPFHPPNQPEKPRTAHLMELRCPALIVQGERDPFGNRAEVESYRLPSSIAVCWTGDGDHDFGPRGGKGFTRKGNLAMAADAATAFAAGRRAAGPGSTTP